MKIQYVPEKKASTSCHRGSSALFYLEISKTEAMELIWKLAKSLTPLSVNRYAIVPGTQPEMRFSLTDMLGKTNFGEVLFSLNIREGYLSGDVVSEKIVR